MDAPLPPPPPLDPGVPGSRNAPSVDRRRKPHVGRTSALGQTSFRERRLGARLDHELGPIGVVLHGRETVNGVIDHLVVAPTGVWVIDVEHVGGRIRWTDRRRGRVPAESRPPGSVHPDAVEVVTRLLGAIGFDWIDVHRVLCFTNVHRGVFVRPFTVDGVWVTWAQPLVERIASIGAVNPSDVRTVAAELAARLPAARSSATAAG